MNDTELPADIEEFLEAIETLGDRYRLLRNLQACSAALSSLIDELTDAAVPELSEEELEALESKVAETEFPADLSPRPVYTEAEQLALVGLQIDKRNPDGSKPFRIN